METTSIHGRCSISIWFYMFVYWQVSKNWDGLIILWVKQEQHLLSLVTWNSDPSSSSTRNVSSVCLTLEASTVAMVTLKADKLPLLLKLTKHSPNFAEIPPPPLLPYLHSNSQWNFNPSTASTAFSYSSFPANPHYNSPSPQNPNRPLPRPASQAGVATCSLGKSEDPREQRGFPGRHRSNDQHQAPRCHWDGHVRQHNRVGPGKAGVGHGNPGTEGLKDRPWRSIKNDQQRYPINIKD